VAHITTIDLSLRLLLLNQLRWIQQHGYEVMGISSPGPDVPVLESSEIRHIPVPMTRQFTPLADLSTLGRLVQIMRRERFTIVHTHNPKPGLLGQVAARLAGVPIVVNTLHGFYFHDHMPPHWRQFYINMERIAARCSDVILSQNREDIDTAVRSAICRPTQIRHLGNGIDIERFHRRRLNPARVAALRRSLGFAESDQIVGFVGRLVAEKGILELLEAAQTIRRQLPSARFLIVGPIDTHKADSLSPAIADEYGVGEICTFTGMRQDMPELYALMDCFVLPSHREGFPRAPMEASAMEVPCVVSDIRGCREAVEEGRNGHLVPMKNGEVLAYAILDLLQDREKARRFGMAGRRMAEEQFDERLVFRRVTAEYSRLLAAQGLPAPQPATAVMEGEGVFNVP
jgi:glycosyltransferase involved in cell wall biosynthesis